MEHKGAQKSQQDRFGDEDLREGIEDVGMQQELVEKNDDQPFQKRAESGEERDENGFFRIDLSRDKRREVEYKDIKKNVETENRAGQAIQKEAKQEGDQASPEP
ncbi:MAG: hypothetical protein FJ088_14430, partial [Deltaproteobacteria bacterium]|nr:hypothetical protein [Deltaproteobacteria bacterium]